MSKNYSHPPCPSYYEHLNQAMRKEVISGGITIVNPNGKYVTISFELVPECLSEETLSLYLREMAAKISKEWERLK